MGSRTSKKRASGFTFENGRCAEMAGCASPQRQVDTSDPCTAESLSSAREKASPEACTQPCTPHQARLSLSRKASTDWRNRRLPYSDSKRSLPRRWPITPRVNSSIQAV